MQVYLVRHGQTEWNVKGLLQGSSDIPLTEEGRQQATRAAQALARRIGPQPIIVTSPLERARHTAQALADVVGVDVTVDDRLRERAYGAWEGITPQERESQWAEEVAVWRNHGEPNVPGFELHDAVRTRMVAALEEAAESASAGSAVVAFAHGSCARVGLHGLLGIPLTHRTIGNLGNTAWSQLTRRGRGDWTLDRHNVTAAFIEAA
ncbi:histidine phosphatase family protein [Demequina globuliformis]|uniref:histidine phosphatase family protein n=1 Tax=Demequina globuliformis TaxID=676202 RepID=UPI000784398C|nr:histidine phosphatase family protein [Demequina globuliformis]